MRHLLAALPVSVCFGRPNRAEVCVLVGVVLLLAGGTGIGWLAWSARSAAAVPDLTASDGTLEVSSDPSGASLRVDDQPRGIAPTEVVLVPGTHTVTLQAADAIPETRQIEVTAAGSQLDLTLWRSHPIVQYLRSALPGAALINARFLADGRLGLVLRLPGEEFQAWTLDPNAHLVAERLGAIATHAPLAIRPDGQTVAMLQPRADTPASSSSPVLSDHVAMGEVWLIPTGANGAAQHMWLATDPAEDLVDLEWAPDQTHLLVVGRQPVSGGAARTAIHWLDVASGAEQDLALLPSEVAPDTYVWSPDGHTVAFVVHTASLAAVCTLSVSGEFRYLGDLNHDGLLGPPVAPMAWAPDDRVLYGALVSQTPTATSSSPFSQNPAGLFLADPAGAPGHPFGTTPSIAPLWLAAGRLLAVGMPGGQETGLYLRELDAQGNARDLASIDVPAPGPTAYGVRWDVAHQRALVITNRDSSSGPAHDYWLVDFGWGTS